MAAGALDPSVARRLCRIHESLPAMIKDGLRVCRGWQMGWYHEVIFMIHLNKHAHVRHHTIAWTDADLLTIGLTGTNFSEIWKSLLQNIGNFTPTCIYCIYRPAPPLFISKVQDKSQNTNVSDSTIATAMVMSNEIHIVSLNVRGLGDNTKRRQVLHWFENKKSKIVLLQVPNNRRIVGGDFNSVLDLDIDKYGGRKKTNINSQTPIKNWLEETDLEDIWRMQHPDDKIYTWHRNRPSNIFCRLDFFLISFGLVENIAKPQINCGYKSDHSMISIAFIHIKIREEQVSGN